MQRLLRFFKLYCIHGNVTCDLHSLASSHCSLYSFQPALGPDVEGDSSSTDGGQHQPGREPVVTLGGSPPAGTERATPPDGTGADGAVSQSER